MMQEFSTAVEETAKAAVNDIHTAIPAKILSFNAGNSTASVAPYGKYITNTGVSLSYPEMSNVPVVFPLSYAGIGMAFPVKPGDNCMLIISECELDEFRTGSEAVGSLKFDMSNSMCIPGLLNRADEIASEAQSANAVVVRNGSVKLLVKSDKVEIIGDLFVQGKVTVTEDVIASGISHVHHTHTGVHGETSEPH